MKNNIEEEVRRIYECGGEIRKLAGEEQSRIFVKGKYFPGLINTISLGDQIGTNIGISNIYIIPNIPFMISLIIIYLFVRMVYLFFLKLIT
jgi:hypothetical protein